MKKYNNPYAYFVVFESKDLVQASAMQALGENSVNNGADLEGDFGDFIKLG